MQGNTLRRLVTVEAQIKTDARLDPASGSLEQIRKIHCIQRNKARGLEHGCSGAFHYDLFSHWRTGTAGAQC